MSKRATKIFGTPSKPRSDDSVNTNVTETPMSGNWSRMAFMAMESKLKDAEGSVANLRSYQLEGLLDGKLPIAIPADAITDEVGTDRVAGEESGDEISSTHDALVENIRQRGQRTPIRVRNTDPLWRPNPEDPTDIEGQKFYLQSGRRRLAACRELGIDPIAFLSFPEATETELDDLQERFYENTSRKDLSMGEKLYSIGLIASMTEGTQGEIGQIMNVTQATISRAIYVQQNFEQLSKMVDMKTASWNQIDLAARSLKSSLEEDSTKQEADPSPSPSLVQEEVEEPLPFIKREFSGGYAKLKTSRTGARILTINSTKLTDEQIEIILAAIN